MITRREWLSEKIIHYVNKFDFLKKDPRKLVWWHGFSLRLLEVLRRLCHKVNSFFPFISNLINFSIVSVSLHFQSILLLRILDVEADKQSNK